MPSMIKELMFKEVMSQFDDNAYIFISNFKELSVEQMSDLRRTLEKVSTKSMVVKHSFAKKIFEEKKFDTASELLDQSVMVTFADANPQDASKALVDFSKQNDKIVATGMIFDGKVYGKDYVNKLASLPSRHELLTQVAVRVKSPISGLVMTLGQVIRGLAVALNQIKEKKEAGAQTA